MLSCIRSLPNFNATIVLTLKLSQFDYVSSRYVFSYVMCFRIIHFILISTAHALFLTCLPVSIYGTYTGLQRGIFENKMQIPFFTFSITCNLSLNQTNMGEWFLRSRNNLSFPQLANKMKDNSVYLKPHIDQLDYFPYANN